MDATPTLLSGAQIDARLAGLDRRTITAVAAAARGTDVAPIAALARATSISAAQRALAVVARPLPAAVRSFSFLNYH